MKFDILKTHSVYKSDSIDRSLKNINENSINETNIPVPEYVFKSMRENAANPDNLKITATTGEKPALYIEAVEFFTYCEASSKTFDEASNDILEAAGENPELMNAEFHVVFPSDCLNKNILGGENLGRNIKDDWAMQLIRGCRRYGLKVNIGRESDYPDGGNEGSNTNTDIEEKEKGSIEEAGFGEQIDNIVEKAGKTLNKEAAERKAVMDKIEEAKKAVAEYNERKKKEKEKKYKEIKSDKD